MRVKREGDEKGGGVGPRIYERSLQPPSIIKGKTHTQHGLEGRRGEGVEKEKGLKKGGEDGGR